MMVKGKKSLKNKLNRACELACVIVCIGMIVCMFCDYDIQKSTNVDVKSSMDSEMMRDDELASIIRSSFKKKITFDIDIYPYLSKEALQIAYDRNLTLEGRGESVACIIF